DFIVLRALERDPARRYPDAKTMAIELESFLQDARFAPRAMTSMLDDLFGADDHQLEAIPQVPPEGTGTAATPRENPAGAAPAASTSLLPISPEPPEEERYASVSSVHRLP